MARSFQHTPCHRNGGSSEKLDKRLNNRRLRTRVKRELYTCEDFDALVLPVVNETSNPYSMNKDGKRYGDWLASFVCTMDAHTRVRDGRSRKFLLLTEATDEVAAARHREFLTRFGGNRWAWRGEEDYDAREDANDCVSGIRK